MPSVTQGIGKLIETLERAAAGENIDVHYVRTLRFEAADDTVAKAAVEAWRRLAHFADDIDIRSGDPGYDEQLKDEMRWRANELVDLLAHRR
jgi:hypothetical protein